MSQYLSFLGYFKKSCLYRYRVVLCSVLRWRVQVRRGVTSFYSTTSKKTGNAVTFAKVLLFPFFAFVQRASNIETILYQHHKAVLRLKIYFLDNYDTKWFHKASYPMCSKWFNYTADKYFRENYLFKVSLNQIDMTILGIADCDRNCLLRQNNLFIRHNHVHE